MMSGNAPFGVMLVTFDSIVLTCAQHHAERAKFVSRAGGRGRRAHLAGKARQGARRITHKLGVIAPAPKATKRFEIKGMSL